MQSIGLDLVSVKTLVRQNLVGLKILDRIDQSNWSYKLSILGPLDSAIRNHKYV